MTTINIKEPIDVIDTISFKIDELYKETETDDRIIARKNINELAELLSKLTELTDSAEAKIRIIKYKAYDQNDYKFDFSSCLNQEIQDLKEELLKIKDRTEVIYQIQNLKYFLRFLLSEFKSNFNDENIELEIFNNQIICCYVNIWKNDELSESFNFLLKEGLSWPVCKVSVYYKQVELNKPTINIRKKVFTIDQLQNFINDCLNSKNETQSQS